MWIFPKKKKWLIKKQPTHYPLSMIRQPHSMRRTNKEMEREKKTNKRWVFPPSPSFERNKIMRKSGVTRLVGFGYFDCKIKEKKDIPKKRMKEKNYLPLVSSHFSKYKGNKKNFPICLSCYILIERGKKKERKWCNMWHVNT